MKIHYIGLSSFLIENDKGFRILVDPFNDSVQETLGPIFPTKFNGQPFGTNMVLISEPDADHSYSHSKWLQNAQLTKPNSDPFPNLDLRGTVIYEYNGDINIGFHYTVDGLRLAHFADNAHLLTDRQLKEIGNPDIIFISPPKVPADANDSMEIVRKNITALNPKIIIWSHQIVPTDLPTTTDSNTLRTYFKNYFKTKASTNQFYSGEESFIQLCYVLENAFILNKEYEGVIVSDTSITVTKETIVHNEKPQSYLFTLMLAT